MSYCRFIEADTYIYDDVYYGLYCCACSLGESLGGFVAGEDYDKMLAHIKDHRNAGDYVPEHVDEQLRKERDGRLSN
jgi:hypothetical protein